MKKITILAAAFAFAQFALGQTKSETKAPAKKPTSQKSDKPAAEQPKETKADTAKKIENKKTVEGKIVELKKIPQGDTPGVLVVVATSEGNETVHLGPEWYVNKDGLKLKEGSWLQAQGWEDKDDTNKHVFMAMEVEIGSWKMKLRDHYGRPIWSK